MCLGLKKTLAWSVQAGRPEHSLTCSFVSRCRSGSGRTARKPAVRPSLSAPPAGRTASGWSAGKRTHSPTNARQSESRSPVSRKENKGNKHKEEDSRKHNSRQIVHQKHVFPVESNFLLFYKVGLRRGEILLFMDWFVAVFWKSFIRAVHRVITN